LKSTALKIFDGLSPSYDSVLLYFTFFQDRYWKSFMLGKLSPSSGQLILDVGCGTCVLEEFMDGSGAYVIGVDLTPAMLEKGASKTLKCVEGLALGDAERLPFASESFDAVVSCYVPKYCSISRFVSEIDRVLKPGGRLLFYDFSRPRGPLFPLHAVYAFSILEVTGILARLFRPKLSVTFKELPRIIALSHWETEAYQALKGSGFGGIWSKRLSGGGVTLFGAEKEGSPEKGRDTRGEYLDALERVTNTSSFESPHTRVGTPPTEI
jgi:demethylmenaquinone methyltransferase/2-methoxy-6-polyprenyl-1,4-benzoquinol methylase